MRVRRGAKKSRSGSHSGRFPPLAARELNIVHVPPLAGIERDEPRRATGGLQDLLVGQGRPGEILRNLLWEIFRKQPGKTGGYSPSTSAPSFKSKCSRHRTLRPNRYIVCEYREPDRDRPLDLSQRR